jgi:hypothetical protein
VKKSIKEKQPNDEKRPKTALDEKFLLVATQVLKPYGITSDRAISLALGRGEDFINKIRRGRQSAPPDAWDELQAKYPEVQAINNAHVTAQGGSQAIGTNNGTANYHHTSLEACQLELEQHRRNLISTQAELEQLRQQLAVKDALLESKDLVIAAKDETISLLRATYNRPN